MSDTYKYLPKKQKEAIDQFDVETFDFLLDHKAYKEIAVAYDIIAQIYSEGTPLNEFHRDLLLYPMKKWGKKASIVMYEFRREYWNSLK